jgi:hypothetical protein
MQIIKIFTKIPSDFIDDFYSILEKKTQTIQLI